MKRLRYTKVNVIGAQNTGKTTLINALAEDKDIKASGLNIMTGMLRRMASEGKINISVDGDPDSQRLMFSYYSELLEQGNNFISDRCVVDVIAYTSEMCDMEEGARKMKFSMEEQYERRELLKQVKYLNPCLNIYLPTDDGIEIVNDGVRCIDEEHRKHIDTKIKWILTNNFIPYRTVRGSVEERIQLVKGLLFI